MDGKSWGVELWDQGDGVFKQLNEQFSSAESFIKLLTEAQKIQHEFGKRLRKFAAAAIPKKKTGPEDTTLVTAFSTVTQYLSSMGSDIENSAKDINDQVLTHLKSSYDNGKRDLDSKRNEAIKLSSSVDQLRKQLDNAWQKYVTAFKEKQKAYDNWIKAEKDIQLPRIEQIKVHDAYQRKVQAFDQSKVDYATELSKYNASHRQHYNKQLMDHLERLDSSNRTRLEESKELLMKIHSINENLIQRLTERNEQIKETVSTIDAEKDGATIIERLVTGDLPPVDLPFLNLSKCPVDGSYQHLAAYLLGLESNESCPQINAFGSGSSTASSGPSATVSMLSGAKRGNLRTPFICDIGIKGVKLTDLTIVQVAERISDLNQQIKQTESDMGGTRRLLQAYEENPDMGSSKLVRPQEALFHRRLNSLRDHIKQLEDRYAQLGGDRVLSEAQSKLAQMQQDLTNSQPNQRRLGQPVSTASVDDFDSDGSFDSETEAPAGTAPGLSDAGSMGPPGTDNSDSKSLYIGFATAKYEYEGNGSTYLAAKPGEVFYVVELDSGNSGWTSVVSEDGTRKGFVPTSFIDLNLY